MSFNESVYWAYVGRNVTTAHDDWAQLKTSCNSFYQLKNRVFVEGSDVLCSVVTVLRREADLDMAEVGGSNPPGPTNSLSHDDRVGFLVRG